MESTFSGGRSRTVPEGITEAIVDSTCYEISRMPTSKSLKILTRLLNIVGGPLEKVIKGVKTKPGKSIMEADYDIDLIAEAVKVLATSLEEDTVYKTVLELAANARINGMEVNFEIHYKGRLMHLLKVVTEVLRVNYGDFLPGLSGPDLAGRLKGLSMSNGEMPSTGGSGVLS